MNTVGSAPGSLVMAALAGRGYAINTRAGPSRRRRSRRPGLMRVGTVLPSRRQPWERMEPDALDVNPVAWLQRRRAHETLRIRAALAAEGHFRE